MSNTAAIEETETPTTVVARSASRDYWLVCGSCFWTETAYSSDAGVHWPPEVVLEHERAYHRRCGGKLKIFRA